MGSELIGMQAAWLVMRFVNLAEASEKMTAK